LLETWYVERSGLYGQSFGTSMFVWISKDADFEGSAEVGVSLWTDA
jgi:hypothetical protein